MNMTDFDDLLEQKGSAALEARNTSPSVIGTSITAAEIRERISASLYSQLSDDLDENTIRASERAAVHVSAIYSRLGKPVDLDNTITREVVILFTIYEMHLSLGNEKAGREYRIKAKDMIVASLGTYPESEKPQQEKPAIGALTVPARKDYPL